MSRASVIDRAVGGATDDARSFSIRAQSAVSMNSRQRPPAFLMGRELASSRRARTDRDANRAVPFRAIPARLLGVYLRPLG